MRYLLYSHDTYGLGHIRRSLRIATAVKHVDARADVLIVTGSPRASSFGLPPGIDVVRLPAVTKTANGNYRPRTLGLGIDRVVDLRSSIIAATVEKFDPRVMLVDHSPGGLGGELLAVLQAGWRPPSIVLGLREIIDDATHVEALWTRNRVWDLLSDCYDEALVYGDQRVLTTADELGPRLYESTRVRHVGYIGAGLTPSGGDGRHDILVTAGGGGDGAPVVERFLEYLARRRPQVRTRIVAGPLLSSARRHRIEQAASRLRHVEVSSFVADLQRVIDSVAGVVTMAGYNTTVELLEAGTPAFMFPRRHPRLEQWIRATRLKGHADFRVGITDEISDDEFDDWIERCLTEPRTPRSTLSLSGADATAQRLVQLAYGEASARRLIRISS